MLINDTLILRDVKILDLSVFNFPLTFLQMAVWSLSDGGKTPPFQGRLQFLQLGLFSSYMGESD